MKSLQLTANERLCALSIFNNPENKVATEHLKVYLDDVDKFRLTEEEKTAVKWKDIKDEQGVIVSVQWDATDFPEKEFEVDEFTRKLLEDKLKSLEVSAADPFASTVPSLMEKIKLA